MATNFIKASVNANWKPAIWNGRPVVGLQVSDTGLMRRVDRYGNLGQVTAGTPNFNKDNNNRLRQFMVCITLSKGEHRCVNLHRVIYETFTGDRFQPGDDIDHKDCNVANGHLSNLQRLSHAENCRKKNLPPPKKNVKARIASWYRYQVCLQLNCLRIKDLPIPYQREYYRLAWCERTGRKAVPRRIGVVSARKSM